MRAACGAAPSPASACMPVDPLASLSRCFTVRGWAAGRRQCPQSGAQVALRQGRVLLVRGRAGQVAEGEAKAVRPQGRTTILEEEWVELGAMGSGNGDTLDPRMSAKPENPNSVAPAQHTHRPGEQIQEPRKNRTRKWATKVGRGGQEQTVSSHVVLQELDSSVQKKETGPLSRTTQDEHRTEDQKP